MTTENMVQRRDVLRTAAGAGLGLLGAGGVWAQASAWPAKPVNLVVPFPAGGAPTPLRPLAAQFSKTTGKTLVIDNRGGAAAPWAPALRPRGGRWLHPVHGRRAPRHCPAMYPKLDYDIEKTSSPACWPAPQVLVVNPKTPSANFKQFLDHVKKNPAKLNYGSAFGAGTSHHLAGELFKQQTGTFITHIPYRGAGPALQDLIGGNVDMMFDGLGSSAAHIRAGASRR